METKLIFEKERETKNTIRYQEKPAEGQPPIIGTLYVAKFWAGGADRVTVTLSKEG
ncbi:MAG TPA: hypothetical protein VK881_16335 [bacterium]|nr:hypothetical protein [bacterium]